MPITTKPLFETQTRPEPIKGQPKNSKIEHHSDHSAKRSKHYHTEVLGGNTEPIKRLNPTETVPAHRFYPGLANG